MRMLLSLLILLTGCDASSPNQQFLENEIESSSKWTTPSGEDVLVVNFKPTFETTQSVNYCYAQKLTIINRSSGPTLRKWDKYITTTQTEKCDTDLASYTYVKSRELNPKITYETAIGIWKGIIESCSDIDRKVNYCPVINSMEFGNFTYLENVNFASKDDDYDNYMKMRFSVTNHPKATLQATLYWADGKISNVTIDTLVE